MSKALKLSNRIRQNSEAAPWVISEIAKLEAVAQQALDAIHYWHWTGETQGAHDLLVKAHEALRDALHPAATGSELTKERGEE